MAEELRQGWLLGFGHPLLDLTANVDETFLKKYNLEKNNAILARPEHESLCSDLSANHNVSFTAGGSTQNAIRVAQWILREVPKATVFLGTIGNDHFGQLMREKIIQDQVEAGYVVDKDTPTGSCAVMLTDRGTNRSLVSFHGAARNFQRYDVFQRWSFVKKSRVIYSAGFTVAANYEPVMELGNHAATSVPKKVFAFNLSAPYVCRTHCNRLLTLLPLVDILFGNENEAKALSETLDWQEEDLGNIASRLCQMTSKKGGRIVIITQGSDPVLVATCKEGNEVQMKTYNVPRVEEEEKVDTNGAGDAFVGGFLGQLVLDASLDTKGEIVMTDELIDAAITSGIECATKIIKVIGFDLEAFK